MKRSPLRYRPRPRTETGCPLDCPWPGDERLHVPWCAGVEGHRCFGRPTHQHKPKKGMGGHNPASRIVAIICWSMHDAVDNGVGIDGGKHYRDEVAGNRYRIYEHLTKRAPRLLLDARIPD